ncbi:MAG: hypothetical protein QXQ18_00520 [Candidatus Aenigmatarchaeota archaeon]
MAKRIKKKNSRLKKIEKFVEKQLEKYIRIHKEHEKELKYIG